MIYLNLALTLAVAFLCIVGILLFIAALLQSAYRRRLVATRLIKTELGDAIRSALFEDKPVIINTTEQANMYLRSIIEAAHRNSISESITLLGIRARLPNLYVQDYLMHLPSDSRLVKCIAAQLVNRYIDQVRRYIKGGLDEVDWTELTKHTKLDKVKKCLGTF